MLWPNSTSSLSPPPTEYAATSFLPPPFHLSLIHLFQANCKHILAYQLATDDPHSFNPDIAQAIQDLWVDEIIPVLMMNYSSKFYLMDSAS